MRGCVARRPSRRSPPTTRPSRNTAKPCSGFQEVEDNLAALRILGDEAEVQDGAVRAARESVTLTTNQYKAGIVSYINVVTVQTTQLNNERTAVGILGRRLVAAVTLVKAVGGGWSAAEIAADNR